MSFNKEKSFKKYYSYQNKNIIDYENPQKQARLLNDKTFTEVNKIKRSNRYKEESTSSKKNSPKKTLTRSRSNINRIIIR
jgi:hypothetical protein